MLRDIRLGCGFLSAISKNHKPQRHQKNDLQHQGGGQFKTKGSGVQWFNLMRLNIVAGRLAKRSL